MRHSTSADIRDGVRRMEKEGKLRCNMELIGSIESGKGDARAVTIRTIQFDGH